MTSADPDRLERELSDPSPDTVAAVARLGGDLILLGAGGKMGPSLARLAARSLATTGHPHRVIAVSRFGSPGVRETLERDGVVTVGCDLLDRVAVSQLPDAPNVIFMAGQKFGTAARPAVTWAANTYLPALAAERYRGARIVVFSTGNVYPLWPSGSEGPSESDAVAPVGEYAQSALGRERLFEYFSDRFGTAVAILRLNYAIEPRYGVLRDLAEQVRAGLPVSLAMGFVNLIWQRDANAVALRALAHAASPPFVLNLTGSKVSVREIAARFAERFGIAPRFEGVESDTALLSNAARCRELFGPPPTSLAEMIDRVATWMGAGGKALGKPTHFEEREGRF